MTTDVALSNASHGEAPVHVAIIMDGNGRWAKSRGLPRIEGHRQGAEAVRRTIRAANEIGISYLTLFGFSSENWTRPPGEIDALMALLRAFLRSEVAELNRNGVRFRVIGDRTRLAPDIVELIERSEASTKANTTLTLTVALSYGGRADIVEATRRMARAVADGRIDPAAICEDAFESELATAGMPDPDLLIRTSGEQRISNFLLWQCAYTELVFLDTHWPEFGKADLERAVQEYHRRERRYGASSA